ncbi:MAG TPA: energy transducer TonB [Longimicrobiales bacterium]
MDARTGGALPAVPHPLSEASANTRFKRGARRRQAAAMGLALGVHALVFVVGPTWRVPSMPAAAGRPMKLREIVLAPEVEVPPEPARIAPPAAPARIAPPAAPARIAPPAAPVIAPVDLPGELAVAPLGLDAGPELPAIPPLPPPPVPGGAGAAGGVAGAGGDLATYEYFMPYMVRPELKNRAEVQRELERRYPKVLRWGAVEGAVLVLFWIDEFGQVQRYEIRKSSGSKALDAAVESVIEIMEFRPAMDRGKPVKVIVALPIRFELY